ncbi:MAG: RNA polymerase sigma factor [Candidatus Krumholzibacteriia bacterium]
MKGDRKAFGMLVEKYGKKMFNAAYRVVNDYEDAMDATQSAFVKAYEKLHTFDSSYRFFSWIYRILVNESINILNHRNHFNPLDSDIEVTAKNPEQTYSNVELGDHLQAALMELQPDYRVAIVLRHYQGMSYKEMGDIVGIPEKTIKSRLFSARRQLRDILVRRGVHR